MTGGVGRAGPLLAARFPVARVLRFGVVGVSATLLYLVLAAGLIRLGVALVAASLAAQLLSLLYSYLAQKAFTFGIAGAHTRYGPRFVLSTALLVVSAQGVVWTVDAAGAGEAAALLTNAVYYPAASFLLHFLWTFTEPETP